MKSIQLSEKVWKELSRMKLELNHKTYEDTIIYILTKSNLHTEAQKFIERGGELI